MNQTFSGRRSTDRIILAATRLALTQLALSCSPQQVLCDTIRQERMCAPVNHWGSMRHSMAEEPQPQFFFKKCIISIGVSRGDTDRAFWGVVVAAVEPIGVCGAARHLQLRATWTSKRPCTRRVVRLKRVQ